MGAFFTKTGTHQSFAAASNCVEYFIEQLNVKFGYGIQGPVFDQCLKDKRALHDENDIWDLANLQAWRQRSRTDGEYYYYPSYKSFATETIP